MKTAHVKTSLIFLPQSSWPVGARRSSFIEQIEIDPPDADILLLCILSHYTSYM